MSVFHSIYLVDVQAFNKTPTKLNEETVNRKEDMAGN